jgi:hypothetical protein
MRNTMSGFGGPSGFESGTKSSKATATFASASETKPISAPQPPSRPQSTHILGEDMGTSVRTVRPGASSKFPLIPNHSSRPEYYFRRKRFGSLSHLPITHAGSEANPSHAEDLNTIPSLTSATREERAFSVVPPPALPILAPKAASKQKQPSPHIPSSPEKMPHKLFLLPALPRPLTPPARHQHLKVPTLPLVAHKRSDTKELRQISATRVARATDPRNPAGAAELFGILMQEGQLILTSADEKAIIQGLKISPRKPRPGRCVLSMIRWEISLQHA